MTADGNLSGSELVGAATTSAPTKEVLTEIVKKEPENEVRGTDVTVARQVGEFYFAPITEPACWLLLPHRPTIANKILPLIANTVLAGIGGLNKLLDLNELRDSLGVTTFGTDTVLHEYINGHEYKVAARVRNGRMGRIFNDEADKKYNKFIAVVIDKGALERGDEEIANTCAVAFGLAVINQLGMGMIGDAPVLGTIADRTIARRLGERLIVPDWLIEEVLGSARVLVATDDGGSDDELWLKARTEEILKRLGYGERFQNMCEPMVHFRIVDWMRERLGCSIYVEVDSVADSAIREANLEETPFLLCELANALGVEYAHAHDEEMIARAVATHALSEEEERTDEKFVSAVAERLIARSREGARGRKLEDEAA